MQPAATDPFAPSAAAIEEVFEQFEQAKTTPLQMCVDLGDGRFVKCRFASLRREAEALQFVRANTTIPVPSVLLVFKREDKWYLVMETIGGTTLSLHCKNMSTTQLVQVANTLREYMYQLENLARHHRFKIPLPTDEYNTIADFHRTNFNIEYADGEFLSGTVGFETVTVGGLAVKQQEIGVVNKAAWDGDGFNSGLIGFASPNLTFVFNGTNPDDDDTQIPYNTFFYSAVQQGLVSHPFLSVALDRGSFAAENSSDLDQNLGFISFGGIALVDVIPTTAFTVPIQGYDAATFTPKNGSTGVTYFYYSVDVELMSFTGNHEIFGTTNNISLDSGTTLDYVPTDVADAFVELLMETFKLSSGILVFVHRGDTFLHNVVATFNIETDEITLTQRAPYTSGGSDVKRRTPSSVRRRSV
ncbi:hypothetical protein HHX47_DHR8000185 [Lentinula edodes]|nr:hypothetical protein HHX47_DHR8000185 [Lentinula edodes]